jgi:two-component system CheB/CheR fusion protein
MGLITLGRDRKVDACVGALADEVLQGRPVSETLPVLIGLDGVLEEVAQGKRSSFSLPRVSFGEGALAEKVVSLEIVPSDLSGCAQILLRDETELSGLEQRVLQQRNELALASEALNEAKERAEAGFRAKAAFLANISHDLKTPLQVIIGNAEILRGNLPEEEREAFLKDVLENSNFLLALITDLLDASSIEADQMELTEDVVHVGALMERVLSMARGMPKGRDRRFEVSIDPSDSAIIADPMRLQRLLFNLIGNAVKFTEYGGRIAVDARADNEGRFVIGIEDDGCGIEPELMKRCFEPFAKGGLAEGSGLGLHIAKGLADLHGADLDLSSEPGAGTRVQLSLPEFRMVKSAP